MPIKGGPEQFELVPEARATRGTFTINVSPADKEVFDAVKWWLSHKRGRPVTQWDVFSYLLGEALGNERSDLRRAELFPAE